MKGNLLTPLSIVLAFIGVIEATLAYRVTDLKDTPQMIFVWFMVLFPTLVLGGFFYVQIINPVSWYPPSELDKASMERLQLLGKSLPQLVSVEMLDSTAPSGSRTVGQEASLNDGALIAFEKGRYEEAIKLFKSSIEVKEGKKSIPISDVAATKLNIGTTLSSLGRYDEALKYYNEALKVYREIGDKYSTSIIYNNLGSVYKNIGEYEKAIQYYTQALEINQQTLGSDHPDIAANLNNLATVYAKRGDLDKAERLFSESLAIYQKIYGNDHPRTATALNNLAAIYAQHGDLQKALKFYEESLLLNQKLFGNDHPRTATALSNLASVYQQMGDYPKALEFYQKSLDVMEKSLGSDHSSTKYIQELIEKLSKENK